MAVSSHILGRKGVTDRRLIVAKLKRVSEMAEGSHILGRKGGGLHGHILGRTPFSDSSHIEGRKEGCLKLCSQKLGRKGRCSD